MTCKSSPVGTSRKKETTEPELQISDIEMTKYGIQNKINKFKEYEVACDRIFFRKNRLLKIIRVIRKSKISRNEKRTTEI